MSHADRRPIVQRYEIRSAADFVLPRPILIEIASRLEDGSLFITLGVMDRREVMVLAAYLEQNEVTSSPTTNPKSLPPHRRSPRYGGTRPRWIAQCRCACRNTRATRNTRGYGGCASHGVCSWGPAACNNSRTRSTTIVTAYCWCRVRCGVRTAGAFVSAPLLHTPPLSLSSARC